MLADQLSRVLAETPDSTAAEIVELLRSENPAVARGWTESVVLMALHREPDRFFGDGSETLRWRLVEHDGPVAAITRVLDSQWPDALPPLYRWQSDALDAWRAAGSRGVVEAVTGAGKTTVGVVALREELQRRGQVLVVVPTVELMRQWRGRVAAILPPSYSVGCLGDGASDSLAGHDVLIGVVNTVRAVDVGLIRPDGLLVADECHRYGSDVNRLALDQRFSRRLGLSATYAREDGGHQTWLYPYFGGTCFELGYRRALAEHVTARFAIALVGVRLTAPERASYDELSVMLRARRSALLALGVPAEPFSAFLQAVLRLSRHGADESGRGVAEARSFLALLRDRRALLAAATGKLRALEGLAPAVGAANRTIVFTRTIDAAVAASSCLSAGGLAAAALHSGLHRDERQRIMASFADGRVKVLAAPQVLDEGVDVPEADLAVIIAASRSRRQMVQRMGRVLRLKEDGRRARFAVIFAEHTVEDPGQGDQQSFFEEILPIAASAGRFAADDPGELGEAVAFLMTVADGQTVGFRAGKW